MKRQIIQSLVVSLMLATGSFGVIGTANAKRTPEEQAAKDVEKAAKNSDRVRLLAKISLDEVEGEDEEVEIENGRELQVKYRSEKGKIRLDAEASNFEEGSIFQVFVGNVKIGTITVEMTTEGVLEGELSFRDAASWPTGLPTSLAAGTVVKFVDEAGVAVQTTLEPK